MDKLLPFKAEYAKSGRATCRLCQTFIENDSLRISKRVRSIYFDGMEEHWYHPNCIFSMSQKPESVGLIANFDNLRWDDQEFLKQKTARRRSEPAKSTPKVIVVSPTTLKRPNSEDFSNFKIEYAQSGDEECYCEDLIETGEIQIRKKDKDTGLFEYWHLRCFADLPEDTGFFSSGSCLPGFYNLSKKDQAIVLEKLPPVKDENLPPAIKREKEATQRTEGMDKLDILMMKQNEKFINIRNKLENQKVKKEDMIQLLTYNDQRYAKSVDDLRDALADRLAFGSVSRCQKCSGRRRFVSNYGYVCTQCKDVSTDPEKSEFKIPPSLREKYEFLKFYISNVEKRWLRAMAPKNLSFDMMEFEQPHNHDRVIDRNELMYSNTVYYKSTILDPKTDFDGIAQVYQCNGTKYAVTLGFTDIEAGYNSFYKLQILQYCHQDKYALFRSWGRTGTQIGSSKVDVMPLNMCIEHFEILFFEKTGNVWIERSQFVKHDFKMYLMDIEDEADVNQLTNLNAEIKSKLQPQIQNLMNLIFNLNIMKNLMIDFKIDVNRMPLGKLSKSQIEKAYEVLQELQNLILSGIYTSKAALIDASNRFYTLIPHSFGISVPPIIDNPAIIEQKCDMLNALLDIEIAYNLVNRETNKNQHPLDAHYEKLNTEINILDSDSDEYKMIEKYAKNTHAHTHSDYTLQIDNVFKIERHGEANRYQVFEGLHNKKLLWHGSRTTNFAGILSQGLRIAPPEAPVSGYMFGKGIYFADMVSKSANYCFADNRNSTGLLLLCEVALGNMYEKHKASPNLRLPPNKHSTFGRGKTFPHPNEVYRFPNGTEVPYGTPVYDLEATNLQLLYNEYIVYNPGQVRTRYLVQVKFNFRTNRVA